MAKISGSDIRPGMVIEHEGSLWAAVKTMAVKPGKGPAYNQVELKNILDGRKLNQALMRSLWSKFETWIEFFIRKA